MDDLISRQAAIDGILAIIPEELMRGTSTAEQAVSQISYSIWRTAISCAESYVRTMPSAEPEIIHCKDCKRQDTDNVFRSMWCYEMRTFVKPNDFCSRADMRDEQDG